MRNKFVEVEAEINYYNPLVVCVSETWLMPTDSLNMYNVEGYASYFNNRQSKRGGGTMIMVSKLLASRELSSAVTSNNAFNVCSVLVGRGSKRILVVAVYRAPWATSADTKELCKVLDRAVVKNDRVVIVGDFNLPSLPTVNAWMPSELNDFALQHNLVQIARDATRENALLDLVITSQHFASSSVNNLPPIGGSDHATQFVQLRAIVHTQSRVMRKEVNYIKLGNILSQFDWIAFFADCNYVDTYASKFNAALLTAVADCTRYKPAYKRRRLPEHVVQLLHEKKAKWLEAKITGDYTSYKAARKTARAAIRRHRRNVESRLIYNNDSKAFYSYINNKRKNDKQICLAINDKALTDREAAEAFQAQFVTNFSPAFGAGHQIDVNNTDVQGFMPTCNERLIFEVMKACSNSDSSPDGISYKLLKAISQYIIRPLNIIFQQSIFNGIFPSVWKRAVVLPLYKGKGDRAIAASYRPISLCSCIGKLLEKIMQTQLVDYLNVNNILSERQHGFTHGKSTVTNIIACDAAITDVMLAGHAYDLLSFDFKAAFDKVPHRCVVEALAGIGVAGTALRWFDSFLSGRTQLVKVNDSLSDVCEVASGVIQGSVCGSTLYTIVADSLLRRLKLPAWSFADDIKYLADVTVHGRDIVQADVDTIAQWSAEHLMPLTIEKCAVLHGGRKQPRHEYVLQGRSLASVDSFKDLGLVRTSDSSYTTHCETAAASASRAAGAIRRAFQLKAPQLLWPAFQSYVAPVAMYASQAWNPLLRKDANAIEKVQRRYTKYIHGLGDIPYESRLKQLNAMSLEKRRQFADLVFAYKSLNGHFNCAPEDFGLLRVTSHTRGGGIQLVQRRATSKITESLFSVRVPSCWNKLPVKITSSASLCTFKRLLKTHLLSVN